MHIFRIMCVSIRKSMRAVSRQKPDTYCDHRPEKVHGRTVTNSKWNATLVSGYYLHLCEEVVKYQERYMYLTRSDSIKLLACRCRCPCGLAAMRGAQDRAALADRCRTHWSNIRELPYLQSSPCGAPLRTQTWHACLELVDTGTCLPATAELRRRSNRTFRRFCHVLPTSSPLPSAAGLGPSSSTAVWLDHTERRCLFCRMTAQWVLTAAFRGWSISAGNPNSVRVSLWVERLMI